jgi:hypothetical protein
MLPKYVRLMMQIIMSLRVKNINYAIYHKAQEVLCLKVLFWTAKKAAQDAHSICMLD